MSEGENFNDGGIKHLWDVGLSFYQTTYRNIIEYDSKELRSAD